MKDETKPDVLKRLKKAEGQLQGVLKMVESDRYCVDVLRQMQAVRGALVSIERLVVDDHVETCVDHALTSGNLDDRREKVRELADVLSGRKR
ncbi:metal-sensitive transcriptional regulator [Parvularcula sp. ZS-1/3]|uniref:Metal-sensitive transcriptional regulator n=1 Tax=Parvularcula mediterranea TaxID=2732508 RepID=A0A7Y3W5Q8_9PROT|nr:metal-sensitive transcriptional regulator [Parvularcula mediterranea]NNU16536.1 metal-sensitive transcriptional regulator [Parvularcula mediterranea]